MANNIEKKFVSEDGFDLCVVCKAKTRYKTETPVDQRTGYVEGAGQLCDEHDKEIYADD